MMKKKEADDYRQVALELVPLNMSESFHMYAKHVEASREHIVSLDFALETTSFEQSLRFN